LDEVYPGLDEGLSMNATVSLLCHIRFYYDVIPAEAKRNAGIPCGYVEDLGKKACRNDSETIILYNLTK
jgi:hypothetical protein